MMHKGGKTMKSVERETYVIYCNSPVFLQLLNGGSFALRYTSGPEPLK